MATIIQPDSTTSNPALINAAPPRNWLRILSIVLCLIGIGISGYLTYTKITNVEQVCISGGSFNCELVQNTVYSRILGVPVQFVGLAGYIAIFGVLLLEKRLPGKSSIYLVAGMTLFGFMFSAYLTAIEAFVIHAWCMWCLGSAITMTALFIVSGLRLWKAISAPVLINDLADDAE